MTPKNNRAPFLCYLKPFASFRSHWWIQTGVTVSKRPLWVKIDIFFSRVASKFDIWPWKTIGHLFYAISSLLHHLVAIGEFKLELQSGNAQLGSKSSIVFSRVTSKFYGWTWKTIGHLFYATSSFVHHFVPIWEFKLELQSGNAQFGSKSKIFFSHVTFKLQGWPSKTKGHLFYDTLSFVHHFNASGKLKLKLQSRNAQFGSKSRIFLAVSPRNFTDDPEKNRAPLPCYFKLCA